ncbi:hypothetical protein WR25_16637 [Diploscapter pachys]|uniref:Uncharacterized protein n=1 Tax=Diploscapter pachys TaxID=2018661 RepID=A0A2A2KGH4_9BILA|nr:hypothetical protein WR25_16637 [Diploscapter pachys]
MQADQRRRSIGLANQKCDMFVARIGRAERDDLGFLGAVDRQPGARRETQRAGCLMRVDRGRIDRHLRADAVEDEGRQQSRDPRQPDRREARRRAIDRHRAERPFQRRREIELRIGERDRGRKVEPRRRLDRDRRVGIGGGELVGQLQRRGAAVGDEQRECATAREGFEPDRIGSLDREQGQGGLTRRGDGDRPAAAQRVDRARDIAGGRAHQKANSVRIGTWSDGLSQLRQASWTTCAVAFSATSRVAHIWSSRRPRSFLVQSGER